jgi:hypothetical protein
MIVRWWFQPGRSLPVGDGGRRDWLRLQWALVDSWIDARKAARSGLMLPVEPPVAVPEEPLASTAAEEV